MNLEARSWSFDLALTRQRPVCFGCLADLGGDRVVKTDGRAFCKECAVQCLSHEAARALWGNARQFVVRSLGLELGPVALHLLTPEKLHQRLGTVWTGRVTRNVGYFEDGPRGASVSLEVSLPMDFASEVLAHELGHAWYSRRSPQRAPEHLHEGFAQWVAYRFCQHRGLERQLARIMNRAGPMGFGVRKLLSLERELGRETLLSRLRDGKAPHLTT